MTGFVRDARVADAPALARVQAASWRCAYDGIADAALLASLTSADAISAWAERWREAIANPPTTRHRVLAAVSAGEGGGAAGQTGAGETNAGEGGAGEGGADQTSDGEASVTQARAVVGFASIGPATDEDRWPGTDASLYELRVLPDQTRQGHGSRLLHAVASTLADDGFHTVTTWVISADKALLGFLAASGWAPDGAHADLDVGVTVPAVRLHTRIAE